MNILILNAHPDHGSFCDAAAAAYGDGAREAEHDVRTVAIRDLTFDLVLRGGYGQLKSLEPYLVQQQELIRWCQHLVVVSPNWWWAARALLKGYVERVFLPEFAMRYHARFPYVEPLLGGRSARVIYMQNSPQVVGWMFRGDLFWQWISRALLGHCGFRPIKRLALYSAKDASAERRAQFLDKARSAGRAGS